MLEMYKKLLERQTGKEVNDPKSFPRFQRFRGTEGASDEDKIKITDNTKTKYGWGAKSQKIAPKSLLKSLQSFDENLKTVDNLRNLIGRVATNNDLKNNLIKHVNKESNTRIEAEHLETMISDLIKNIEGVGEVEGVFDPNEY
jgi:hypothetical protein